MRIVRPGDPDPRPADEPPRQINISRPIRAADGSAVGVIVAQLSWDWMRDSLRGLLSPDEDGGRYRQTWWCPPTDYVLIGPPSLIGTQSICRRSTAPAPASSAGVIHAVAGRRRTYITGVNFAAGEGQFPGAGSIPMRWTVLVRECRRPRRSLLPGSCGHEILGFGAALTVLMQRSAGSWQASSPARCGRSPPPPTGCAGARRSSCRTCAARGRSKRCPPRCARWSPR